MDSTKKTTTKDLFRNEELGNHNNAPGVCSIDSVKKKQNSSIRAFSATKYTVSVIDSLRFDLLVTKVVEKNKNEPWCFTMGSHP